MALLSVAILVAVFVLFYFSIKGIRRSRLLERAFLHIPAATLSNWIPSSKVIDIIDEGEEEWLKHHNKNPQDYVEYIKDSDTGVFTNQTDSMSYTVKHVSGKLLISDMRFMPGKKNIHFIPVKQQDGSIEFFWYTEEQLAGYSLFNKSVECN
jgi:hypothetical protein